ncbi:unnamed protein product, partial [marine sediment metagenome]
SDSIQTYIDRKLCLQTYEEHINGTGNRLINTKNYPITLINEIQINCQVLEVTDYELTSDDATRGQIYRKCGWPYKTTSIGLNNDRGQQLRNIRLNYDAGYVLPADPQIEPRTLPYGLEGIVKTIISNQFTQISNGVGNLKRLTEGALTYEWIGGLTDNQLSVLNSYSSKI